MTPGNAESRVGGVTADGTEPGALFSVGAESVAITSDDCYTPRWVFDAMGLRFDLDVAAPVGGPWHVPCDHYYTAENDGLAMPWYGSVWCNPPYSNYTPWAERFASHKLGVALMGIVLPEVRWFPIVFDCSAGASSPHLRDHDAGRGSGHSGCPDCRSARGPQDDDSLRSRPRESGQTRQLHTRRVHGGSDLDRWAEANAAVAASFRRVFVRLTFKRSGD